MGKSNTNFDKLFDNNNGNIKAIERFPHIKISNLSIILYLLHCSEVVIPQYSNVKSWICTVNHWKRMKK